MYDARQIANCLLDIADQRGRALSHLPLQKIIYFGHGLAYAKFGKPLIVNRIEAWKNGPVVRELYFSFNSFGDRPISGRAQIMGLETGKPENIPYDFPDSIYRHLEETFDIYGPIPAWRLVAMTHEKESPWAQVIESATNSANVGMVIDEALIERFFSGKRIGH